MMVLLACKISSTQVSLLLGVVIMVISEVLNRFWKSYFFAKLTWNPGWMIFSHIIGVKEKKTFLSIVMVDYTQLEGNVLPFLVDVFSVGSARSPLRRRFRGTWRPSAGGICSELDRIWRKEKVIIASTAEGTWGLAKKNLINPKKQQNFFMYIGRRAGRVLDNWLSLANS